MEMETSWTGERPNSLQHRAKWKICSPHKVLSWVTIVLLAKSWLTEPHFIWWSFTQATWPKNRCSFPHSWANLSLNTKKTCILLIKTTPTSFLTRCQQSIFHSTQTTESLHCTIVLSQFSLLKQLPRKVGLLSERLQCKLMMESQPAWWRRKRIPLLWYDGQLDCLPLWHTPS